jgi:molybdate/tungstate transport system ATP-binding protein
MPPAVRRWAGDEVMIEAVFSVSRGTFTLKGEIHDSGFICLTGLNGSGKSTVLNVIAGNLKPESGYVRIDSADITGLPQERRGVVLVNPDSFIPHLQVEAHLRWGASLKRIQVSETSLSEVKERLGIDYAGRVDKLSLGMRERVALATALLSRPRAILVDEAFSNIDHRESFIAAFRDLCRASDTDVLHTTQNGSDPDMADHHYEIVDGVCGRVF